jgi:hypothetical protein
MDPSFAPRLVGPREVNLLPDVGTTAAARWSLAVNVLPPGHYTLVLPNARDLVGHAAAPLAYEVDVPVLAPSVDGLPPEVRAIAGTGGVAIVGDDAGEVPLAGATSVCGLGRTAVLLQLTAGHHLITFLARDEGDFAAANIAAFVGLYDATGRIVGTDNPVYFATRMPSAVAGFASSTETRTVTVETTLATSGLYTMISMPNGVGPTDTTCGGARPFDGAAMTIDDLVIR